jgi:hypothetical protein
MVTSPANNANAEQQSVLGNPILVAKAPHIVLPIAIPPCNTSKYIDNARARTQGGVIVCAAVFKHARIPIQAPPAVAITTQRAENLCTCPAANVMPAKMIIAVATTPSTESRRFSLGRIVAPINAPTPNVPSKMPNPVAPYGRATMGNNASRAIAPTLKAPVRISTDFTSADLCAY